MDIRNDYPEFEAIEGHIRRAHAERSVYIAHMIAEAVARVIRGFRHLAASLGKGLQAEHERQLIEADAFLKRSVPKY